MSVYTKLASAIYNDVVSGLRGYHQTPTISIELLEDDIVDERLSIIKEYILKGIIPKKDLMMSINCIPVDCKSLDRCFCKADADGCDKLVAHFEIPQVSLDFGGEAIEFIGTTDRGMSFVICTSRESMKYNKYRKRGKSKPYVYIDFTPNENGMNDCFIFNAPLIKMVSIVFIPKDARLLELYQCCPKDEIDNISFINNEIKRRLTEKKVRYYRSQMAPLINNDQTAQ